MPDLNGSNEALRRVLERAERQAQRLRESELGEWVDCQYWNMLEIQVLILNLLEFALDTADKFEAEAREGLAEDKPEAWLREITLSCLNFAERARAILEDSEPGCDL